MVLENGTLAGCRAACVGNLGQHKATEDLGKITEGEWGQREISKAIKGDIADFRLSA